MERGSYSKLDHIDQIEIELNEHVPAVWLVEPSERNRFDGPRQNKRIDYVLVHEILKDSTELDEESAEVIKKLALWRDAFERFLESKLGLILQRKIVNIENQGNEAIYSTGGRGRPQPTVRLHFSSTCKLSLQEPQKQRHFTLIHAPWEVLVRSAEEMKLKVPIQVNDVVFSTWLEDLIGRSRYEKLRRKSPFVVHDATIEKRPSFFVAQFMADHLEEFLNHEDKESFFSTMDRFYIVQQLLHHARFARGPDGVGLQKLLFEGAYIAGFLPHDGPDTTEGDKAPENDRQRLKNDWAGFGRSFKYQPYEAIKDYFGHEVGLYFSWLGFYTAMLVPLALLGPLVFIYGIATADSHIPVRDLCSEENRGRWYMCPLCDKQCSYWDLAPNTCLYAYVTHFFDNGGTVFLAFVASIWAKLFLEFWKRREADLALKWHTTDLEKGEEPLRPEYKRDLPEEHVSLFRKNPDTGKIEPVTSRIKKYHRYGTVFAVVGFMILLVLGAVIGVIVYRAAVFAVLSSSRDSNIQKQARHITTATAGIINLIAIMLLTKVYIKLAAWLTDWENPPTETAYKDSFTWKMSLFQFVNNYSSIFYIAFFKSELIVGTPGRYRRILGKYRLDSCSEQGCFLELTIQLFIIMVGKQIFFNVFELAMPFFKLLKNRRSKNSPENATQYENDFDLSACERHYMFWEYLEIVLHYGFVTMFVAAFPLGPLFALVNAIIEIRLDAIKYLCYFRRPDVARVADIGAWFGVLEALTGASVLVNAFLLAFTSGFIPKLLYRVVFASDRHLPWGGSLKGYVNSSLAVIDLNTLYRWEGGTQPDNPTENLNYSRDYCRYPGYLENTYPYSFSKQYWHLLAARLAFVFVFQFVVFTVTSFIAWVIPDTPDELKFQMEREKEIVNSIFYRHDYDSDFIDADEDEDDEPHFADAKEEVDS